MVIFYFIQGSCGICNGIVVDNMVARLAEPYTISCRLKLFPTEVGIIAQVWTIVKATNVCPFSEIVKFFRILMWNTGDFFTYRAMPTSPFAEGQYGCPIKFTISQLVFFLGRNIQIN
ncbi:hypothetical protein VF13_37515 [Nostoc linckia z16]|nr:hypothetical protein VF13_37515 [Nostoc linckia z16]